MFLTILLHDSFEFLSQMQLNQLSQLDSGAMQEVWDSFTGHYRVCSGQRQNRVYVFDFLGVTEPIWLSPFYKLTHSPNNRNILLAVSTKRSVDFQMINCWVILCTSLKRHLLVMQVWGWVSKNSGKMDSYCIRIRTRQGIYTVKFNPLPEGVPEG